MLQMTKALPPTSHGIDIAIRVKVHQNSKLKVCTSIPAFNESLKGKGEIRSLVMDHWIRGLKLDRRQNKDTIFIKIEIRLRVR